MKIIASNLTDYLITRQYVSAKKRAWCIYFIQKKLLNIISIIMVWIISIHNRLFIETLLFASAFLLLRKRTGGLHMNSPYLCIFFSSLLIYYIPYGIPLLIQRERIIPLILLISFYIIQKFAPLNHPGIHMTENITLQDAILKEVRKDKVPVTLFLMNGFQLRGIITGFDSFVVVLVSDGKQQMIYKHAISTLAPMRPLKSAAPTA